MNVWNFNSITTTTTFINTDNKWIMKKFLRIILTSVDVASNSQLFRDTPFIRLSKIKANNSPKRPIIF